MISFFFYSTNFFAASEDESSETENQGMSENPSCMNTPEPLHPAFFNWEDIDEFEMSSRSADSIDEVESQTPSVRKCNHQSTDPAIVLLSHSKFDWDTAMEKESLATGAYPTTEESEIDDVIGEEYAGRPEKGFYDVSMFYVNLAPSEEDGPLDEEEERDLNYYLHPDIKIEMLFAQQRKHRHIAQLLKLSQRQLKESVPMRVPIVRLHPDQTNILNPQPVFTKLREDSSWIKPAEMSPEPSMALSEVEESKSEVEWLALQILTGATVDESSTDNILEDDSVTASNQNKSEEDEVDLTYKKEDIPWSSGTVKNFTKDFEERIRESDTKIYNRTRSASSGSTNSSSLCSGDEGVQENNNMKPETKVAAVGSTQRNLDSQTPRQSITDASSASLEALDKTDEALSSAVRPASIYDTEEILLEPGIVRRTKQEIESRK